jgi:putative thymidine phosphorylase
MFYLKPKKIDIIVGNRYVVLMNSNTAHHMDIHAADRIFIKNGNSHAIAIVDISEHQTKDGEIGLYLDTWNKLQVVRGDKRVSIEMARKPQSIAYIREKLEGKKLNAEKLNQIIEDVVKQKLSDVELTYFVSGCYVNGLDNKETVELTKAIVKNGGKLEFKNKVILDKHCIGGVPGNRTTLITVPICAAAGVLIPKTSSRAITSPAGTADTMEVLANVQNDAAKLTKIAKKVGGFISWGGGVDLASADDYMIKVRNPLSLDPQGMLLASILAKKHSVSANYVVIDIPYGPDVKVKTEKEAQPLKSRFEKIATMLGMKIKVILTDGKQPIGRGIGPILECIDCLQVLNNDPNAPNDLRTKAIFVAGEALELCGKAKKGQGQKLAIELLTSGKAAKKFQEMIDAQGRTNIPLTPGKFTYQVKATKNGTVKYINNKLISRYARMAGAPIDMGAGITMNKYIGDKIKKGDVLFTIYAETTGRLADTIETIDIDQCYKIA